MGLAVKLQTMQQLTILPTFFQIRRVHIELIFSYNSIVFIIIVIDCQAAFKFDCQVATIEKTATCPVAILKFS